MKKRILMYSAITGFLMIPSYFAQGATHTIRMGNGRPIGIEIPARSIGLLGGGHSENNTMDIGPIQQCEGKGIQRKCTCEGFHQCGQDQFNTSTPYWELEWYELDPVATDPENFNRHPKIRHCQAALQSSVEYNSDLYFQENCVVYAIEHRPDGPKKIEVTVTGEKGRFYLNSSNLPIEQQDPKMAAALRAYQKRGEAPAPTPEQQELVKKLKAQGWKPGPMGQLVPPSIAESIGKKISQGIKK